MDIDILPGLRKFFRNKQEERRVIIVLDASTSMRKFLGSFLAGWKHTVKKLEASSAARFKLVTFNSERHVHTTEFVTADQLPKFDYDCYSRLLAGGTYLRDTLAWALTECIEGRADAVRVLTDGWDRGAKQKTAISELTAIVEAAREAEVDFQVIGFGLPEVMEKFRSFLWMAELREGEWHVVDCPEPATLAGGAERGITMLGDSIIGLRLGNSPSQPT